MRAFLPCSPLSGCNLMQVALLLLWRHDHPPTPNPTGAKAHLKASPAPDKCCPPLNPHMQPAHRSRRGYLTHLCLQMRWGVCSSAMERSLCGLTSHHHPSLLTAITLNPRGGPAGCPSPALTQQAGNARCRCVQAICWWGPSIYIFGLTCFCQSANKNVLHSANESEKRERSRKGVSTEANPKPISFCVQQKKGIWPH